MTLRCSRLLIAASLLGTLAACQQFPRLAFMHKVRVIPAATPPGHPQDLEDRLYADAASAIERREYDTALDALQMAKDRRPNDARVLNALGVVYDKLGRFDLSTHYYDLAEKADPGSKVVASNRQYSLLLQGAPPAAIAPDDVMALASSQATPPRSQGGAGSTGASVKPVLPQPAAQRTTVLAQTPGPAAAVAVQVARPAPRAPVVSEDEHYRRAVALIQRRAHGEALGELMAAKAMKANDPRVLSALGVVYDWLGRFDLSAHYYDLAEAADPGSVVVAINRQYSQILQRHGGAIVAANVVMPHDQPMAAPARTAAPAKAAALRDGRRASARNTVNPDGGARAG